MRCAWIALPLLALPACFNPDDSDQQDTDPDAGTQSTTAGTTTDGLTTTAGPTTGDPTTDTTSSTTSPGGPNCGDGVEDPDEDCDDGINNGAYGTCNPDCTFAPYCGDAQPNGDEQCDDGTNDGSYGTCNQDCTLAIRCGDGTLNGNEMCDEGDANQDGESCNSDCTNPGVLLGEYESEGLGSEGGEFVTSAQFNGQGEALVAFSKLFDDDARRMLALDNETLEVARTFDPIVPEETITRAAIVGDIWILSASPCNYSIEVNGTFAEFCGASAAARVVGQRSMISVGGGFVGLDRQDSLGNVPGEVAGYDVTTDITDASDPAWRAEEPDGWQWLDVARGPMDSVFVSGSNANGAGLSQFTSAGNLVEHQSTTDFSNFPNVAIGSDGSVFAFAGLGGGGAVLVHLTDELEELWRTAPLAAPNNRQDIVLDQQGDVVMYSDSEDGDFDLAKYDGETGTRKWTLALPQTLDQNPAATQTFGLSIAPDNKIWVSLPISNNNDQVALWVGRVSP